MTTTEIDDVQRIVPYPIEKHRDGGTPYYSREIRIRCRDGYTLIRLRAALAAELRMPGDAEPASPVPITRDGASLLSPQAKATLDQVRREWAAEDAAREPDEDDLDEEDTITLPEPNGTVAVMTDAF